MDIQVASNFERYLYYLVGEDSEKLSAYMSKLQTEGKITVEGEALQQVQKDFAALGVKNDQCLNTIAKYQKNTATCLIHIQHVESRLTKLLMVRMRLALPLRLHIQLSSMRQLL